MTSFFYTFKIISFIIVVCLLSSISAFAQAPLITSFDPKTVCQGDVVTITGTGFTNVKSVKLGTDTASKYTVVNATTITANVSTKAATGVVIVTTNNGADTTTEKLTINPLPDPDLEDISNPAGPFTNCDGNATYALTVGNKTTQAGTGANYDIDWGDASAHFTQTSWAVNGQTTHTYSAQGYFKIKLTVTTASGCTKTITKDFYNGANPLASITTTTSTTGLCAPATITFEIGNWYNNSTGTTYELDFGDGTTDVVLPHPLNNTNTVKQVSHTYTNSSCPNIDFTATLKASNGCYQTTYTLNQIVIRKKPIADFTVDTPVCVTDAVCFTNTTTDGSSGNNTCYTVSNYLWDFGDGTTSTSPTPACHKYASAGTYTVTLTSSNATCGGDTKTKTVVVKETSTSPTVSATPVSYCQGDVAVPLTATGTGLLWYTSATGGTGSSTAPTPSTAIPGTTTYYVSQTLAGKCESPRVPISVVVHAIPAEPGVNSPINLCKDQSASPLTATGSNLLWYTSATGGTGSSTAPTPSTTTIGSFNFYVSQTISGCESKRAVITVVVATLPAAPTVVSPIIYCQNQPAVPLTASGTGLRWYTAVTGGTGSTVAPTPSTTTVGNTDYYVSQSNNCGESPRALITVTVKAAPFATISYPVTNLCNVKNTTQTPNPPVKVTLTGSSGGTYSISPSAGLLIDASGSINPSEATAGTYTIYYKIVGTGGCSDFITSTTVTVNGTPNASITYPAICTSNGNVNVQLTGTQGGSYSSTTGLTINASTGVITPSTSTPGNYVVTYTIAPSAPCPGFTTTTNVTVTKAPSAIITYNVSNLCNVENTPSTPNPPVDVTLTGNTGGTYSIQPSSGLSIDPTTGQITPSGATAGTYTISYTIKGSGGCSDFVTTTTVTVDGTPYATISYPPNLYFKQCS